MSDMHLVVRRLRVVYGRAVAVRDVSLELPRATITAVVGPNGAGKSSLFLGAQGVVGASVEELSLGGRSLAKASSTQRARRGLVLVPQGRQIFSTLTVRTNLQIIADALHLPSRKVDEALDRFPILRERHAHPAGVLSGGEQQMLALARALMSDPEVLLLDEPTEGLAPVIVAAVQRVLEEIRAQGGTILIAEPTTRLLPSSIDKGYVMMRGEIVAEADSKEALHTVFAEQFSERFEHAVSAGADEQGPA